MRLKILDSLVNHPAKNRNNDLSQMMDYLLVKAHMIQIQQVVPLIGVFVANVIQCLRKLKTNAAN